MHELVDAIHSKLMEDADFSVPPGNDRDEAAWKEAWLRFRQHENNEKALEMQPEEESMSSDTGLMKKQAPPGPPPRPGLVWDAQRRRWIRPKDTKISGKAQHLDLYHVERAAQNEKFPPEVRRMFQEAVDRHKQNPKSGNAWDNLTEAARKIIFYQNKFPGVQKQMTYFSDETYGKSRNPIGAQSKMPKNEPKFERIQQDTKPHKLTGEAPKTALERLQKWLVTNSKPVRSGYVRNPLSGRQVKKKVGIQVPKRVY